MREWVQKGRRYKEGNERNKEEGSRLIRWNEGKRRKRVTAEWKDTEGGGVR